MKKRMYGENGRHPYSEWTELKECWRRACAECSGLTLTSFTFIINHHVNADWWISAPNPHGWDITIKARGLKK